jgi:signal transduction histidine kinase
MAFNTGYNMRTILLSLEKWRWLILAMIGLSLLWVEVQEFLVLRILNQAFHYFEVFQYAVLLISTGVLLELYARSIRKHQQSINILESKHRISLALANQGDWESLIQQLTLIPGEIADVEETYFLIFDPLSGEFEQAGYWRKETFPLLGKAWNPGDACTQCMTNSPVERSIFHRCEMDDTVNNYYIYCLKVANQNIQTALLKFRVRRDAKLTREQEEVFRNIHDEIVLAIQASQERRRLSEMQSAEVAMAERRMVSTYVHDQLGQNLGFMHLKLDQLSTDRNVNTQHLQKELNRLREVANESYEIVRDILKKMQPETVPHLTNLLHEHARIVSRRSDFTLDFRSKGKPVTLSSEMQQIIFFTFREILSNVERHACANNVEILVTWSEVSLDISVKDDGNGFDPPTVRKDEHFGLGIMEERISRIKGKLTVQSSQDIGTTISISIPLGQFKEAIE